MVLKSRDINTWRFKKDFLKYLADLPDDKCSANISLNAIYQGIKKEMEFEKSAIKKKAMKDILNLISSKELLNRKEWKI